MTDLNYQTLVHNYYENLNTNLRHFTGGPGFLESWAHDEDHNRSLLEILDLALAHKVSPLHLTLPNEVLSSLRLDWLQRNLKSGTLELVGNKLCFTL
jgi:hypothetical protein